MEHRPTSLLHRCVSAQIRALMAARRVSGKSLAEQIGTSQNYVAKRLRDEATFTLDDVEKIMTTVFHSPHVTTADFILDAYERNINDVYTDEERDEAGNGGIYPLETYSQDTITPTLKMAAKHDARTQELHHSDVGEESQVPPDEWYD
ncbi:helix-turn-helix transcriptional regulator [Schaalia sp. ZJ405]|uniref:helix-turn-helix domain-containing protein n=1 Tax=Schaalia sp. ZJ405 TaxID=2709403 RepID=UPI0018C8D935|nr:helix-turn-helix transcriptional regulator [Schaalia sp. ZJ405]QPK81151.1 helix-turn-helix transcriptional regulator [Schaalia sp. ZJ405]